MSIFTHGIHIHPLRAGAGAGGLGGQLQAHRGPPQFKLFRGEVKLRIDPILDGLLLFRSNFAVFPQGTPQSSGTPALVELHEPSQQTA